MSISKKAQLLVRILALAGIVATQGCQKNTNKPVLSDVAFWQDAVRKNGKDPKARYFLATSLREVGNLVGAEAELKEATRLQPQNASIRMELGNVLWDMGRRKEARDQWKQAKLNARPRLRAKLDNLLSRPTTRT
jgi:Flp pilus assembly protein TadD